MVRSTRKILLVGAIVLAALLGTASQSEAFWGCGWGCGWGVSYYTPYYSSWCSPCYSSCYYSSCYYPCYSSCYSYCAVPARRCLFGGYRWYYSGGCCDTCCCDPCACGDTVVDGCCGNGATTTTVAPAMNQPTLAPPEGTTPATPPEAGVQTPPVDTTVPGAMTPPPADTTVPGPTTPPPADTTVPGVTTPPPAGGMDLPGPTNSTMLPTRQNSGLLTVWVPANAKVYINGRETSTQGSRRRYVSHGLQKGLTYKYEVRAEIVRNGMVAEEQKTIYLTAGASEGVAFGFNREPSNQVAAQQ